MKPVFALVFLIMASMPALAQDTGAAPSELMIVDAQDVTLEEFRWVKRPIVVFADTPADPRYAQQMAFLNERPDILAARDVVVITDTDPAARSSLRQQLRPRGFGLVLMGKDGVIYLRKPVPWDVREITRAIDKSPDRQQELRNGRAGRS